jgi:hypothetical protein
LLRGSKDAALALAVRGVVNARMSRIGEMTELSVDTKKRTILIRLELRGEDEPIELHIKKYGLKSNGDSATLTILDATASRAWIEEALQAFVVGRSFEIPPTAAAVLKLLA